MPEVHNPSPGPGAVPLLARTVTLNSAALVALASTPFTLVPAPGAGKILMPFGFAFIYDFGTIAYQGTNSLQAQFAGAANDLAYPGANAPSGLVSGLASSFAYVPAAIAANVNLAADANQALQLQAGTSLLGGPIATATLGAGGTGYVANDTGTIVDGSDDATYKVLTVGAGGAVVTFQVTSPGTAYTVENGVATATGGAQPGVGVGFTANITAVTNGNGTLKVTTYYQVLPVP